MNEPIAIIALDLDGTLLDPEKKLSPRNRAALERAAAAGIEIVPTTGRFFGGIPEEIRDLPFVRYAITVNGAQVFDRRTETVLSRAEIPLATALSAMTLLDRFDVIYDCYQDNWGWMSAAMIDKAEEYAPDAHYLKMIRELRHPVPDLKAHVASLGKPVQKVMCFAREWDAVPAVRDALAREVPQLVLTQSTPNNVEMNDPLANKGEALKRLAAHLGFGLDACMAIGDGLNDLSMVEVAGYGVAMANATPQVAAAARFRTLSNGEDGVAAAIERFVPGPGV
ncbi:MAG: Cof-type HAD-IIB family hydrolase [Kiritimatiellae bacterium]|nr:Cof-type HAD-IIB family hydrolase [Kiritimatiellia bacterium]